MLGESAHFPVPALDTFHVPALILWHWFPGMRTPVLASSTGSGTGPCSHCKTLFVCQITCNYCQLFTERPAQLQLLFYILFIWFHINDILMNIYKFISINLSLFKQYKDPDYCTWRTGKPVAGSVVLKWFFGEKRLSAQAFPLDFEFLSHFPLFCTLECLGKVWAGILGGDLCPHCIVKRTGLWFGQGWPHCLSSPAAAGSGLQQQP